MKPSIFVGSSSEALQIAEAVQTSLSDVADVTLWNQAVFKLNETALDSLVAQSRFHDYAIFVLAEDDVLLMRDELYNSSRDNVIFELGLFTSALGSKRCFFIVPTGTEKFHVPTDLSGITYATYDQNRLSENVAAAISSACTLIKSEIRDVHVLSGEWNLIVDDSEHNKPSGKMFVTCAGNRAVAKLNEFLDSKGNSVDRSFRYEGRYVSGQFVLNFEQRGAEEQIVGCMVLRASADRQQIQGVTSFWHHDRAMMVATYFQLVRSK